MTEIDTIDLMHFDIVTGCQLSCMGCPTPTQNTKIEWIEPKDFYSCLCNIDVKKVNILRLFNYGEPLLHPKLAQIGQMLEKTHLSFNAIEISTNGQKCNWDDFEELIKLKIITQIAVSCDGDGTWEEYEKFRPPAKWHKLMQFLERCSKIVTVHSPATRLITRNIINRKTDIQKWEELLKPYGFTPEFRGWKQLPEGQNNMTTRQNHPAEGICKFLEHPRFLFINAHGDVVPCCAHPKAGVFGNIMRSRFSEIINGHKRALFLHKMQTLRKVMAVCSKCEFGPSDNPGPSAGYNLPTEL